MTQLTSGPATVTFISLLPVNARGWMGARSDAGAWSSQEKLTNSWKPGRFAMHMQVFCSFRFLLWYEIYAQRPSKWDPSCSMRLEWKAADAVIISAAPEEKAAHRISASKESCGKGQTRSPVYHADWRISKGWEPNRVSSTSEPTHSNKNSSW